tara:strand:- start:550 stop:873 length:324 start_codon:yes stop_codon:yes gene_type:complete
MGYRRKDIQRQKKIYPFARRKPIYKLESDQKIKIEVATISFVNEDTKSYSFQNSYTSAPPVSIGVKVPSDNLGLVNVYISALSTTSITLKASAPFTGDVFLQILEIL